MDKGSGSGIFPDPVFSRIRVTQKDRIRNKCNKEIKKELQGMWNTDYKKEMYNTKYME